MKTESITLDAHVAALAKVLTEAQANKFGSKTVSHTFAAPCGEVVINLTQSRVRHGYGQVKVVTQFLLDSKVIARTALQTLLGDRAVVVENAVLKAAFLGLAPDIALDYVNQVRRVYAYVAATYPDGKVPAYPKHSSKHFSVIRTLLSDACLFVQPPRVSGVQEDAYLVLEEEKLLRVAKKYGDEVSLTWYAKTNEKLGGVADVAVSDHKGGELSVTGDLGGKRIDLSQQRIIKSSPRGNLFHQFPARIYVDGKFTTEAAFKKMVA